MKIKIVIRGFRSNEVLDIYSVPLENFNLKEFFEHFSIVDCVFYKEKNTYLLFSREE